MNRLHIPLPSPLGEGPGVRLLLLLLLLLLFASTLHAQPFLRPGDRVALVSPGYVAPEKDIVSTIQVLEGWGLEAVVAPNVGKTFADKYAGTPEERVADLRWALADTTIKAILCNRGGYGALHLIELMSYNEWRRNPKWLVGFSDVTTLHGLLCRAGVMCIHGTMSMFLADGGTDTSSILLRDLLFGSLPRYEVPPHPENITGHATGTLVGGNLCTLTPLLGTKADPTAGNDFILFLEDVDETMHNIDRQFKVLELNGVLDRCKGVVLGSFSNCKPEFSYPCIEAMLRPYIEKRGIPLLCGFPAGHSTPNMPLILGAPVTIDVRPDGASLSF